MSLRWRSVILLHLCALCVSLAKPTYVNAMQTARYTFVSTRKPLNSIALTGILCGYIAANINYTPVVGPNVLTDINNHMYNTSRSLSGDPAINLVNFFIERRTNFHIEFYKCMNKKLIEAKLSVPFQKFEVPRVYFIGDEHFIGKYKYYKPIYRTIAKLRTCDLEPNNTEVKNCTFFFYFLKLKWIF